MLLGSSLPGGTVALPPFALADKVAHAGEFFVLTLLVLRALPVGGATRARWWLVALVGYGGLDEVHQLWIPGRSAELTDWAADAAGVLLAAIIIGLVRARTPVAP
jgi:VanZ family protein